jgi:hypothetical protein
LLNVPTSENNCIVASGKREVGTNGFLYFGLQWSLETSVQSAVESIRNIITIKGVAWTSAHRDTTTSQAPGITHYFLLKAYLLRKLPAISNFITFCIHKSVL